MAYGVTEVRRAAGRRPPDRRAARAAAGRRQEPVVVPHLEGEAPAGRGRGDAAPRLPRAREERADKLSGAWGRHPLLGRMYLPAYRAGTEQVAELRRKHPPEKVLPALYGANGLVDATTLPRMLEG